jgi:hypothetical protein
MKRDFLTRLRVLHAASAGAPTAEERARAERAEGRFLLTHAARIAGALEAAARVDYEWEGCWGWDRFDTFRGLHVAQAKLGVRPRGDEEAELDAAVLAGEISAAEHLAAGPRAHRPALEVGDPDAVRRSVAR